MRAMRYILAAMAAVLLASCKPAPMLTLSQETIDAAAAGTTVRIKVTSNYDWSTQIGQAWTTLNPNHGSAGETEVVVATFASKELDPRQGTITFACEDLSRTLTIRQAAKGNIEVAETTRTVDWDDKSLSIEMQANIDYAVTISQEGSWIKESATKGMSSHTHTFALEPNESHDARIATITFTQVGAGLKAEVTVTQNGMPSILVIEHGASTLAAPTFKGQSVKGQVDWGDTIVEALAQALTHSYTTDGTHRVQIEVAGVTSFTIDSISGIDLIDISRF